MYRLSAINWLIKQIENDKNLLNDQLMWDFIKKTADMVEKENIIEAHYRGGCDFQEANECRNQEVPYNNDAEQYYNETYK